MFHAVSGMLCCNEQRAAEFLAEAEAAEEAAEAEEPRIQPGRCRKECRPSQSPRQKRIPKTKFGQVKD